MGRPTWEYDALKEQGFCPRSRRHAAPLPGKVYCEACLAMFRRAQAPKPPVVMVTRIEILQPRVELAPYRTFPEIQQPSSDFVFRAQSNGEGIPKLMLIEADGGRWKVDAIQKIAEALAAFELGIPIIA